MVNSKEKQLTNESKMDDMDRVDQLNGGDSIEETSSPVVFDGASSSSSRGVTYRDLPHQLSDREDNVLQWLLALDMQVMGACRADERLKPLLKLNVASGAAEDRLLSHLSQHFEPTEIGMLARCLCIPLVSIRVGRINKQRNLLCPANKRGNLNLILLPTSDLWISFVGDDGLTERMPPISADSECADVEIEGIPADKSGRSFLIKIRECEVFYFWCCEKSQSQGIELLRKMKDLVKSKPSLSELTGISESRLDCFAIHLRAYLAGSMVTNAQTSTAAEASLCDSSLDSIGSNDLSSITSLKSSQSRHRVSQSFKSSSFNQVRLSPRPSSFKDGTPRNVSSLRSSAKERLRHHGDGFWSCFGNVTVDTSNGLDLSNSNFSDSSQATGTCIIPPLTPVESFRRLADPSLLHLPTQFSSACSQLSPHYCWCPPGTSTLPYTKSVAPLPVPSAESFSLPSLSSLLSSSRSSSLLSSPPPFGGSEFPSLDFPPLVPETLVRSQLATPSSQQIPTFTPLMCDPIVHIPVIEVCSSGQGFLVSAGPAAISTTIPPLHANLVSPLISEAESIVEKGARETLRWLIGSSSNQHNSLINVLPSFMLSGDQKADVHVAGSRGFYTGTKDVNTLTNCVATMELFQLPKGAGEDGVDSEVISSHDVVDWSDEPSNGYGTYTLNDDDDPSSG